MKKLAKLRLINWHFFEDQEFLINDNCLLYGENGCGKSTILDAIHYVLSGGTCKFNKAANLGKSERTVFSYMKARTGSDIEEYVRTNPNIISDIALEFFDTSSKSPYIFGVVLQITANQQPINRFYEIKGAKIDDSLFYADQEKSKLRGGKDFFDHCRELNLSITSLDNNGSTKTCKSAMVRCLEVTDSYLDLLEKAISFSDLGSIDDFARDFIFEENPISSSNLEQAAESYKKIKSQLETEEKKLKFLKPINDEAIAFYAAEKEITIDNFLIADENVKEKTNQWNVEENELSMLCEQENQLSEELADLDKKKTESISAFGSLNGSSQIEVKYNNLLNEKRNYATALTKSTKEISDWRNLLNAEKINAQKLGFSFNFEDSFEKKDFFEVKSLTQQLYQDFDSEKTALTVRQTNLADKKTKTNTDINACLDNIDKLGKHLNNVQSLLMLQEYVRKECIKNGISESEISILPLFSGLEVKDEKWRNALEGLLGVFRFDLIVPKSQFNFAYTAFLQHPELRDYFGFGIVRLDYLEKMTPNVLPNSIVNELDGKNSSAFQYAKYLIGDYQIVEGENFDPNNKGINADGLFFDGVSIRRINPEAANTPFLGSASFEIRKEREEKRLKELKTSLQEIENELLEIDNKLKFLKDSKIASLTGHANTFFDEKSNRENYENSKAQADALADSEDLLSFQRALDIAEKAKDKATCDYNNCFVKYKNVHDKKNQKTTQHETTSNEIASNKKLRDDIIRNEKNDFLKSMDFMEYKKGIAGGELIKQLTARNDELQGNIKISNSRILQAMIEYGSDFDNSMDPSIDNLEIYLHLYRSISQDDLPSRIPAVQDAKDEMERLFKEDFASNLVERISGAKDKVKELNSILVSHKFGTDEVHFRFRADPTNKEGFKDIAKILDCQVNTQIVNPFLFESLTGKEREAFESLFQVLIGNKGGEEVEKQIHDYCDYRNYLDYDIQEIDNEGNSSSYKKNQKSKSGGETQTPFYVMIAAAFNRSIKEKEEKQKASPCALVILDEAFNNMDEERISEMLHFYNELKIQLIISVPTNRAGLIIGKVGTQIAIVRKGTAVAPYMYYSPMEEDKAHAK